MAMSNYAEKIDIILAKMFTLKPDILPANQNSVEQYLHHVWVSVTTLTFAFWQADVNNAVLHCFKEYTHTYQSRLTSRLGKMKFCVNTADAVRLICGPGLIEKVSPIKWLNDLHR